jgi:MoxR-like ATPase
VAKAVLRHRIVLEYNARIEGLTTNDLVRAILDEVPYQAGATPRTLIGS